MYLPATKGKVRIYRGPVKWGAGQLVEKQLVETTTGRIILITASDI